MARFRLSPREERFFTDFVNLSGHVRNGARALQQMMAGDRADFDKATTINEIEHLCDADTRAIIDRLNRTVTPLDREDIHALASSLDDVMDAIDAAAAAASGSRPRSSTRLSLDMTSTSLQVACASMPDSGPAA